MIFYFILDIIIPWAVLYLQNLKGKKEKKQNWFFGNLIYFKWFVHLKKNGLVHTIFFLD